MSCSHCNSTGYVQRIRKTLGGDRKYKLTCIDCGGTGIEFEKVVYKDFIIQKVDETVFIVPEFGSEFHSLAGSKKAIDEVIEEFEQESEHLEPDEQYDNIHEYVKDQIEQGF
jgi:hypothetical protein